MMKKAFQKESQKSESDIKVSENPSDFRFAKNCGIPTTFGVEFELQHIPKMTSYSTRSELLGREGMRPVSDF